MRSRLLSLTLLTTALMAGVPAAAERASPSGQSGVQVQVTVSARIVSGESIRFGEAARHQRGLLGSTRHKAPLARSKGQMILDGQQPILLTEFH